MADGGGGSPVLHRPIPRRPFAYSLSSPTPPGDDDDDDDDDDEKEQDGHKVDTDTINNNNSSKDATSDDSQTKDQLVAKFRRELQSAGLFDLQPSLTPVSSTLLFRPQSSQNLASSTLAGIYSPTVHEEQVVGMHSPWGTGAESPVKRSPGLDEATFNIMRERHLGPGNHPLSYHPGGGATARRSSRRPVFTMANASALSARAALLFALGVGYGFLLTRFKNEQGEQGQGKEKDKDSLWYLIFCGAGATTLGALQPWFDGFWEDMFESETVQERPRIDSSLPGKEKAGPSTDWALIMRAIGAFVGIAFAIRKLAWTSTMQVSIALALVNPLLWWLIDRSTSGLVLSSTVALTGSAILFGIDSNMMPSPPSASLVRGGGGGGNSSSATDPGAANLYPMLLNALVSQETVESAIWMLSVLFCSSLCFGNIGRRLAWGDAAGGRGRWGGMR